MVSTVTLRIFAFTLSPHKKFISFQWNQKARFFFSLTSIELLSNNVIPTLVATNAFEVAAVAADAAVAVATRHRFQKLPCTSNGKKKIKILFLLLL